MRIATYYLISTTNTKADLKPATNIKIPDTLRDAKI